VDRQGNSLAKARSNVSVEDKNTDGQAGNGTAIFQTQARFHFANAKEALLAHLMTWFRDSVM
jgi:hypothetical protein